MKVRVDTHHPEAAGYHDLNQARTYEVVGIEASDYRIVNENGKPYLYPAALFEVLDPSESTEWLSEIGPEGERYAYPPELAAPGFFEDWFDGDPRAQAVFAKYLKR